MLFPLIFLKRLLLNYYVDFKRKGFKVKTKRTIFVVLSTDLNLKNNKMMKKAERVLLNGLESSFTVWYVAEHALYFIFLNNAAESCCAIEQLCCEKIKIKACLMLLDLNYPLESQEQAYKKVFSLLKKSKFRWQAECSYGVLFPAINNRCIDFDSRELKTHKTLEQAVTYLRYQTLSAMHQDDKKSSWAFIKMLYEFEVFLNACQHLTSPVLLMPLEQGLMQWLESWRQSSLNIIWYRRSELNYALMLMSMLGCSYFFINTHHTVHSYAQAVRQLQRRLRDNKHSAQQSFSLSQWHLIRTITRLEHHQQRFFQWSLMKHKAMDHLIVRLVSVLLPKRSLTEFYKPCLLQMKEQLGWIALPRLLSHDSGRWFSENPVAMVYLKHYKDKKIKPCVKNLLAVYSIHPKQQRQIWAALSKEYYRYWLHWLSRLSLAKSLDLVFICQHFSEWGGLDGVTERVLKFVFEQAGLPQPFKIKKSHHFRKKPFHTNQHPLAAYWNALQSVEHTFNHSPLQYAATVLQQRDHSLHKAMTVSEQTAKRFSDPLCQKAVLVFLQLILHDLWKQTLWQTAKHLQNTWSKQVVTLWQQHLQARFPFSQSHEEADLASINRLFQPQQGALWRFIHQSLQPFIKTEAFQEKLFMDLSLPFRPGVLHDLQQVDQWMQSCYEKNGTLQLTWKLYPNLQAGLSSWILHASQSTLEYHNGPQHWREFHSPSQGPDWSSSLTVVNEMLQSVSLSNSGVWSLWRLLRRAHVRPLTHQQYFLQWHFPNSVIASASVILKTNVPASWWFPHPIHLPDQLFELEHTKL